jgi:hypothetical protein
MSTEISEILFVLFFPPIGIFPLDFPHDLRGWRHGLADGPERGEVRGVHMRACVIRC